MVASPESLDRLRHRSPAVDTGSAEGVGRNSGVQEGAGDAPSISDNVKWGIVGLGGAVLMVTTGYLAATGKL